MSLGHPDYYPPRAKRVFRLTRPGWFDFKRLRFLQRLQRTWLNPLPWSEVCWGLLVPGAAYGRAGWKRLGRAVLAGYLGAWVVFWAALGTLTGSFAFGVLVSAHATSIAFLLTRWLDLRRFWLRLAVTMSALLVVGSWLYFPLRALLVHCFLPVRLHDRVMVVNGLASPASVRRGDWIAYTFGGTSGRGYVMYGGADLAPVLAVPGDQIQFREQAYFINGVRHRAQAYMPTEGQVVVPEKTWFVWPRLAIRYRQNGQVDVKSLLMTTAMVTEERYLGKPFTHWFGMPQPLP
jgi:hypothetical protein